MRRAVVIGVNSYTDPDIPDLSGAVNDATEMYQRLKQFGDFEIADDHFLINEKADCLSVRKAISDLLWRSDDCELALFYFSGHGFQDGYSNGYIAPSDMSKNEPFVSGINMEELKQVVSKSLNKQCVLVILDCCFSGISTKGEKAIPEVVTPPLDSYFSNLNTEAGGEGKIIFASSGENQKSRESSELKFEDGKNVCHGIFTYHLIKGLDGEASDNTGIITLDRLRKYVEDQFVEKKQKPKFYVADSSQLDRIKIAKASAKYKKYILETLSNAIELLNKDDFSLLIKAVDLVNQILKISEDNKEALELKNNIEEALKKYKQSANAWLFDDDNANAVRENTKLYKEFNRIVDMLVFHEISKLELRSRKLLIALCDVSTDNITKERFFIMCRNFENPTNLSAQNLNPRTRN